MQTKWMIISLALLATVNCGRSQNPEGALGIITGEKSNSKSGENHPEPSSTKEEASNTNVSGYCLQGDCTAPASPTANINFALYSYFPGSQTGCQMGADTVLVKSLQANRMTIFYRALYASVGRWQLYAQNVGVDAGGVMTPMGERVNLLPGCNGNTAGVVAFDVKEYSDATGNSGARTFNLKSLERAAAVKVDITCVNAAQSASRTIDLSSLLDSDKSTVHFLERDGAIGFWASKNVFIKADGTTLNPDGSAGSLVIPGYNGSNISRVIGEEADGIYIQVTAGTRYVTNNLSNASVAFGGIATGSFVAPDFGLFVTTQSSANAINFTRWQGNAMISRSNELYGMFSTGTGSADVYGRYSSECIRYASLQGTSQLTEAVTASNCGYYAGYGYSRLAPISRNQKVLLWHATSANGYSCRIETTGYGCQLAVANLANGVVTVVKVDRQALDFYNVDRGFFGGRWITERHDGDRGVIYLSNSYFD